MSHDQEMSSFDTIFNAVVTFLLGGRRDMKTFLEISCPDLVKCLSTSNSDTEADQDVSSCYTLTVPELRVRNFLKTLIEKLRTLDSIDDFMGKVIRDSRHLVYSNFEDDSESDDSEIIADVGYLTLTSILVNFLNQKIDEVDTPIELDDDLLEAFSHLNIIIDPGMNPFESTSTCWEYLSDKPGNGQISKFIEDIVKKDPNEFDNFMGFIRDGDVDKVLLTFRTEYLFMATNDGYMPLHAACEQGNIDLVMWFCNFVNIEACTNEPKYRPIHLACIRGRLKVVQYLFRQMCSQEARIDRGERPMHLACIHGHLKIVKFLFENLCNIEAFTDIGQRPVHLACIHGHLEIVRFLYEKGCNIEACTDMDQRPVHLACIHGHLEIVRLLCDWGCKIEDPGWNDYRPIHLACIHGHLEIVKFLYEQSCDINVRGWNDYRPIHLACIHGHITIVEYLCQQKCDIETVDTTGYRPLYVAWYYGHMDVVKYLCQQNCEIEAFSRIDESVTKYGFQKQHYEILKFLSEESLKFRTDEILKQKLIKKISTMKLDCDDFCDHSFCLKSISDTKSLIDRGGFGSIYKVEDSQLIYTFCMKCIKLDPNGRNQKEKHIEFNVQNYYHALHHKRIVRYFGTKIINHKMVIFMEYVEGTSLDKRINKKPLPHNILIKYSKEILEGLKFLHQNKILHRDIKPQNIMLDMEEHVKLCDFGLSCYLENSGQRNQIHTADSSNKMSICGTYNYMAPEIVTGEKYSYPLDIWGLGASVVEMLTGKPPFHDMDNMAVLFHIGTIQKIEFVPAEPMSQDMKSFVDQMLCSTPSDRATAEILLEFINERFPVVDLC